MDQGASLSKVSAQYEARILLCLVVLMCEACGWQRKVAFYSPSMRLCLEVYQPPVIEQAGMRLDVVLGGRERVTVYHVKHEIYMTFAYAYWSQDEGILGFLACGSGPVEFAYDIQRRTIIPFERVAKQLRESMIRSYLQVPGRTELNGPFSPCDIDPFVQDYAKRYPNGITR